MELDTLYLETWDPNIYHGEGVTFSAVKCNRVPVITSVRIICGLHEGEPWPSSNNLPAITTMENKGVGFVEKNLKKLGAVKLTGELTTKMSWSFILNPLFAKSSSGSQLVDPGSGTLPQICSLSITSKLGYLHSVSSVLRINSCLAPKSPESNEDLDWFLQHN